MEPSASGQDENRSEHTLDVFETHERLVSKAPSVISDKGASLTSDVNSSEDLELVSLSHELELLLDPKNNLSTPPPLVSISPFECTRLQEEELETLRAIYEEDLHCLSECCFVIIVRYLTDDIRDEDVIKVWFSLPPNYPSVPPVFELEASQSGVCTYSDADELYDCLVTESLKRIGDMMIFDLVTMAQEFMSSLVERKKRQAEERVVVDQLGKEKLEAAEAAKKSVPEQEEPPSKPSEGPDKKPLSEKVDSLLWSGVVVRPTQIIGRISEIVKKLPDDLQITRIENVLRQDLAQRFCQTLREASEQLWKKERLFPHEIKLKPQVAFHGTLSSNLPSIVQRGLVIPGRGNNVRVRCGSSLGLGIYLSPSAQYSLGYSSSDRLVVCAVLQGRIYREGTLKESKAPHSGYYSVESSCGNEWVVFNAGQVLPCYVIKVQKCDPRKPQPPPLHSLLVTSDGGNGESVKDKKAALLARARKFLPYGFGPGGKTIIEEAASFDDDEEDYEKYQESRHVQAETGYELQEYRYKEMN